jgi:hypothetical protein
VVQFTEFAQADHDRPALDARPGLLVGRLEQHHRRGARRSRIQTEAVALGEAACDYITVDLRFRGRNRVALVVTDQDRVARVAQIHAATGDLQRVLGPPASAGRLATAEQGAREALLGRIEHRAGFVAEGLFRAAHARARRRQAGGLAALQQIQQRRERRLGAGQAGVIGVHIPDPAVLAQAVEQAGVVGHAEPSPFRVPIMRIRSRPPMFTFSMPHGVG